MSHAIEYKVRSTNLDGLCMKTVIIDSKGTVIAAYHQKRKFKALNTYITSTRNLLLYYSRYIEPNVKTKRWVKDPNLNLF